MDIAVSLLKFRTKYREKAEAPPTKDQRPQSPTEDYLLPVEPVFAALISLLKGYLVGDSRKNELYMGRHMDFFLNQIGDSSVWQEDS